MKSHKKTIVYEEYSDESELSGQYRTLLKTAKKNAESAYAPYSNFKVGAALLMDNEEIVCGSNQENVAFPSGICAERVAMFSASANYPRIAFKAIAVYAEAPFIVENPVSPCGTCRQVMTEYEILFGKDLKIILGCQSGKVLVFNKASDLLPFVFYEDNLKNHH